MTLRSANRLAPIATNGAANGVAPVPAHVSAPRSLRRRDRRVHGVLIAVAAVLLGGAGFAWLAPLHAPLPLEPAALRSDVTASRSTPTLPPEVDVRRRFDAAVLLLHGRQFDAAAAALARVLELAPRLPEAHVNLGFAQLGSARPAAARVAFETAISLKPEQANAYYGLAMVHEAQGDLELALGAMRSYLHLARSEDEAHLRRARAALWEWQARLAEQRDRARHPVR